MIVIPSREDGGGPRQFSFRHPADLVGSHTFSEILHFVQDDSAFVAAEA